MNDKSTEKFWFDDPYELINNWGEMIPMPGMSYEQMFNSISRMVAIAAAGYYAFGIDPFVCVVISVFFTLIYSRKNITQMTNENYSNYEDEYPVKEYEKIDVMDKPVYTKPMNSESLDELMHMGMHIDNDPFRLKAGYKYMNGLNRNDKEQFEKRRRWDGTYCATPNYQPPTYWKFTDEKSERDRVNKYRW